MNIKHIVRSIKEKPAVYFIFIVSILVSVMSTATFYRAIKATVYDEYGGIQSTYDCNVNYDNSSLYSLVKDKIVYNVKDLFMVSRSDGGEIVGARDFDSMYFEEENTNKIIVSNINLGHDSAIVIGDDFDIGGVEFAVVMVSDTLLSISGNMVDFIIPANISYCFDESLVSRDINDRTGKEDGVSLRTIGDVDSSLKKNLASLGLRFTGIKIYASDINMLLIIAVLMVAMCMWICFICYSYISNENRRLYCIYKTVGAKSSRIALIMILEIALIFSLIFFVGIGIEIGIITLLNVSSFFAELVVTEYLIIFAINILLLLVVLLYNIVRVSISCPIIKKIL